MDLTNEQLIEMYITMNKIRTFENRVAELFADGKIPGFVHLYVGEEAVATGASANLTDKDYITSTHRGHGHLIAKGGDIKLMMAELFGKKTGYCKGTGLPVFGHRQRGGVLFRRWRLQPGNHPRGHEPGHLLETAGGVCQ
jgi:TPP-dependent pyruvate/acetoin dehydrogenase alpha subunit